MMTKPATSQKKSVVVQPLPERHIARGSGISPTARRAPGSLVESAASSGLVLRGFGHQVSFLSRGPFPLPAAPAAAPSISTIRSSTVVSRKKVDTRCARSLHRWCAAQGVWSLQLGSAEETLAAPLKVVERFDDLEQGQPVARNGELEASARSTGGGQNAALGQLVQSLGEVVSRHRELFRDRLDGDGIAVLVLRKVEDRPRGRTPPSARSRNRTSTCPQRALRDPLLERLGHSCVSHENMINTGLEIGKV